MSDKVEATRVIQTAKVLLENVNKAYGKTHVVQNFNLEVKSAEFLCLLGPSGCGKTTTLSMIAGVETQDSGNIYIGDRLVNDLPPKDRHVAMVFQSYALYPNKTVYENLAFPLKVRGNSGDEIRSKVKATAEILRMEHLLDRYPGILSGGERQRVAIGRAIVQSPEVYIYDEPLTNLDAQLRVHMRSELKRLQLELKTTTIYATPDQAEAMAIADRIAVMDKGCVLQEGTPQELYRSPADTFVAGFIGSPPINFMGCTIVEKKEKLLLDVGVFQYDATHLKELLKNRLGEEVTLGIRPEHIRISKEKIEGGIEAVFYSAETVKPEHVVHFRLGELNLMVLADETFKAKIGERFWLSFDADEIKLYSKAGKKLTF